MNKVKAYSLQDLGLNTVEANERLGFSADLQDYSMAAQILKGKKVNPRSIMCDSMVAKCFLATFTP